MEHPDIAAPDQSIYDIPKSAPVLWINGLAGTGKSTIAHTIAKQCKEQNRLGGSFFCARTGKRSNVQLIFPTIALHLAELNEHFRDALRKAVETNSDIHHYLPGMQLEKLIVEPLQAAANAGAPVLDKVIVIDALDECRDREPVSVILAALSQHVDSLSGLRIIVTSRPEDNITQGFGQDFLGGKAHNFRLSDVPKEVVAEDIGIYLRSELEKLRSRHPVLRNDPRWPGDERIEQLVKLAVDLFIFAATTVKYLSTGVLSNPAKQLSTLLSPAQADAAMTSPDSPFSHLDKLYLQVLQTAFGESITSEQETMVKMVIGSTILILDQLSPASLDALLCLPMGTARHVFQHLGSVFVIPEDERGVIEIIHPSFTDFMEDNTRCTNPSFTVNPTLQHTILAMRCLEVMNTMLTKDTFDLGDVTFNSDVTDLHSRISDKVPQHLLYACRNWMEHMRLAQISSDILGALGDFCNQHMLQWLEVLSVTGAVDLLVCSGLKAVQNVLKVDRLLHSPYFYSQYPVVECVAPKYIHSHTPPS